MRIAVIADTHGRLPESVAVDIAQAKEIWHLGDFCDLRMLEEVRALGPDVRAIAGNNDFGLDLPERLVFECGGFRFLLMHIPPRQVEGVHIFLHGHTHVPRDEWQGETRILNPGSVGKANKGAPASYAWLEFEQGQQPRWTVRMV